MTNQKLKKEFAKLGYELSYGFNMQAGERGWSIRKFGTTNEIYVGSKEAVEYKLVELS